MVSYRCKSKQKLAVFTKRSVPSWTTPKLTYTSKSITTIAVCGASFFTVAPKPICETN